MALTVGAFTFAKSTVYLTGFSLAAALQCATDLRNAMATALSGEGWSAGSSEFSWQGTSVVYGGAADLDHTNGAKLWVGVTSYSLTTPASSFFNAANYGNTGNFGTSANHPSLFVAYWPPGSGVTLAANPGTTNDPWTANQTFIAGSIDPLRFVCSLATGASSTSTGINVYYAAQGDTVWLTHNHQNGSSGLRNVLAAGQIIIPTSPTDVASYAGYGIARLGVNTITPGVARASATNAEIQCYTELATTAETTVLITTAYDEIGAWTVLEGSPVYLYPIYVYKNNSVTWPGIKGYLDPALAMAGNGVVHTGARVGATGERTHLGNGLYMGYQAGAGDWYLA